MESVLRASGARRVLDLGCGAGALLERLVRDGYDEVVGVDVSIRALEQAARRLKLDLLSDAQRERIKLLQSPLTYRDRRLTGYDAAVLVEVIEHLDPPRLAAAERNVFASARPSTVVVTTPNGEYNVRWETLACRAVPPPRPPLRVDARGVRTLEQRRRRPARVPRAPSADRSRGPGRRAAHADGGVRAMRIELPDPSLVVLIGPSGSGKSSFAARHFRPTEVLSSDVCRGLVSDDENDQAATEDAFAVLHFIAGRRLTGRRLTVVDATNVQREARKPLVALAREHDLFPVAVVLDMPEAICLERNRDRPDRDFGAHVVKHQRSQLGRSLKGLQREGFRRVWVLRDAGGRRGRGDRPHPAVDGQARRARPVRRHRRRPRLRRRARRACSAGSATRSAPTG